MRDANLIERRKLLWSWLVATGRPSGLMRCSPPSRKGHLLTVGHSLLELHRRGSGRPQR
jgi:hypothetical protein